MKRLICIGAVLILLASSGCIDREVYIKKSEDNYIKYDIGVLPEDLLMLKSEEGREKDLLYFLFEGLVGVDSDGAVVPALASAWEISEDGLTYTFNIREDACWSDGSSVTARDFVNFFSAILAPGMENQYAYQLKCIYGANEYRRGKTSFKRVAVSAPEEKKLEIRLNYKYPDFLKILSQPIFGLRKNVVNLKSWRNNYRNISFTGPYIIKEVIKDGSLILSKNERYWNEAGVKDNLFMVIGNSNREAALAEFETSRINIMPDPPLSEVKRFIDKPNTVVVDTKKVIGIVFNFSGEVYLRDINFRKAIGEVLNPDEIAEKALPEYEGIISAGEFSWVRNVFTYNSSGKTEEIVGGNGSIEKMLIKPPATIKLAALNSDKNKRLVNTISQIIENKLGINVQAKLYSSSELEKIVRNRNFDLMLKDYEILYDSAAAWFNNFSVDSSENSGKFTDTEFENALRNVKIEDNNENYIEQCESILAEELPVIPLFNDADIILKSENITNLRVNYYGYLDFADVSKEKN